MKENIALPLQEYTNLDSATINMIIKMKLGMVNLAGYENHYPSELSGGMKKRAGIARAMALDPIVLFFDELSAGLDPVTAVELDDLIIKTNEALGTTMVIVTHELESICKIAHRVLMLDKKAKGIIAEGKPLDLKEKATDPRVRSFFLRQLPEADSRSRVLCQVKASKFLIGLFVIIGTLIAAVIIIWVGAADIFMKGSTYVTYFDESVQGLQADSAVKYRGVEIGKVKSIKVAPDYRLIEVIMKIDISGDLQNQTDALLRTAGITGIVFIELDQIKPGDKSRLSRNYF